MSGSGIAGCDRMVSVVSGAFQTGVYSYEYFRKPELASKLALKRGPAASKEKLPTSDTLSGTRLDHLKHLTNRAAHTQQATEDSE